MSLLLMFGGVSKALAPVVRQALSLSNANIVCDGNSLTFGAQGTPYPTQLAALSPFSTNGASVQNLGISGQTTDQMAGDYDTQVVPLYNSSKANNIYVCWEVTNDMFFGATAQVAFDELKTLCLRARTTGFYVVTGTVLPRSESGVPADFETRRQAVNTLIRNNWTTFADELADFAADIRIGDAGDQLDTTYYATDKVHLNTAGYGIIAALVKNALQRLKVRASN